MLVEAMATSSPGMIVSTSFSLFGHCPYCAEVVLKWAVDESLRAYTVPITMTQTIELEDHDSCVRETLPGLLSRGICYRLFHKGSLGKPQAPDKLDTRQVIISLYTLHLVSM
jgi:hypothetical protein